MEIDRPLILQTFLAESLDGLTTMETGLVLLESKPEESETLNGVFRAAHTLKGDAASLGYHWLSSLAHRLEDVLDRLRNRDLPLDRGLTTLMLAAIDAFREILPRAVERDDDSIAIAHRPVFDRLAELSATTLPRGTHEATSHSSLLPVFQRAHTLRVSIGKLDRMLDLMGEIAIARGRLGGILEGLGVRVPTGLIETHADADALLLELQELIMKVRMVPVGPTFRQCIRAVRDVANERGKLAELVVEGEDVELDMTLIEHIRAPLTHMVRNAVDHGIESPDVRAAAGKDRAGKITLRASRDAGSIVIQVSDDGGGMKRSRIIETARARGICEHPETLPDRELLRLVLEPGFSTAENVNDVSGRGMGMDIVRNNIDALRGGVMIESLEGIGTTVTLRLPLTLAIIDGFAVTAGRGTFILPLGSVRECMDLPRNARRDTSGRGVFDLRGEALPFVRLRDHLGLDGAESARESLVIVDHEGAKIGIAVDGLLGGRQTVIKPLGPLFRGVAGFSGCTLLGSGTVALILDLPALLSDLNRSDDRSPSREALS